MSDFRLKAFYSVAKNLSFTKAAKELFISQPAITKHIHELESAYRTRLFDRMGNKISLTDSGKVLLEHCEQILSDYRRLEYDMHLLNNEYSGDLRIGASTTIAQYVLPPILARFNERYPNIHLSLLDTNSRNIEQALLRHDIELGLVEGVSRLPDLKYEPILRDELVAVVHRSCSLPIGEEITVEDLRTIPLALRERGSGTLDVIETALLGCGMKLSGMNVRLHLGSTESIKSFLRYSNCMGIVSLLSVAKELKEGLFRIVDIDTLQIRRHFCFARIQGQDDPSTKHFIRFVHHYLAQQRAGGEIIGKMYAAR